MQVFDSKTNKKATVCSLHGNTEILIKIDEKETVLINSEIIFYSSNGFLITGFEKTIICNPTNIG